MAQIKSRVTSEKTAAQLWAEEESRVVVAEAKAAAETKAAAKAKTEEENRDAAAEERTRVKTKTAAEARATEEARIAASGKDEWFYLQNGEQFGPVSLVELRNRVMDPSIEPLVKSVWTEGMEGWKPVYDVRRVCEPLPSNEVQIDRGSDNPDKTETVDEVGLRANAEAKAAEDAKAAATEKARTKAAEQAKLKETAEASLRADAEARAAEVIRIAAVAEAKAEEEKTKAVKEANLRAAAEAKATKEASLRAAAESKAVEESRLRIAAEAKAAEQARIAAEAKAKVEREARAKADEEAKLRATAEAKIAEEVKRREVAEAKAAEESKLRAAAEAKAEEEAKLTAAARAIAEQEARALAFIQAKAAEEAKVAAVARAEEEARALAVIQAKAAEEAKVAAVARAEEEARAKAVIQAKAAEEAKVAAVARAEEEARVKAEIDALAVEEARVAAVMKEKAENAARVKAENEARLKASITAEKAKTKRETEGQLRALAKARADEAKAKAEQVRMEEGKTKTAECVIATTEAETTETKPDKATKPAGLSAKSIWYYTCEGNRLGPVRFDELRSMAANSSLDPRLDMVWKKNMETWKPAGQIDGLFERQNVPAETHPLETPAAPTTSYRPPQRSRVLAGKDAPWPGARRRSILIATLIFPFVWQYALGETSPFLVKQFGQALMSKILPAAALAPVVVLVYFWLKRLINLGMSRLWCFAVFAPILNLWLCYRCLACPPGYAYHKRLDGTGVALAILYWSFMLSAVLILASAAAPVFGKLDISNLPGYLRTAIQSVVAIAGRTR